MVKYADDTYLVVPEVNSALCEDELKHIDQWATDNNLRLNQAKTVEIVFYARGRHHAEEELPLSLPGIQRVSSIKVLGVTINPIQSNPIFIVKTQLTERSRITDKHSENHIKKHREH